MPVVVLAVALWVLRLLAPLAAHSVEPPKAAGERLRDSEEAVVDVRVERRGEAVRGIAAGDFHLALDGHEVALRAVEEAGPGSAVPLYYLLFIDDFFSVPSQRNRILDGIRSQLDLLRQQDRMAVLSFDGETVEVLSGWTRSLPALEAALARSCRRPSHGLLRLAEQRQFELSQRLTPRRFASGSFAGVGLSGSTRPDQGALSLRRAREITGQVATALRAATAALYALPNDRGRRVMIMLSGGWQVAPDRWVVNPSREKGPYTGLQAAEKLFEPLIESADQRGYTLYPVAVPSWSSGEATLRREPLVGDMLRQLAVETGGIALLDERLAGMVLKRVSQDLDGFYRLRFATNWHHDQRRRRLKLVVKGGRYRGRTRLGLADPSRHEQIRCLAQSAGFLDRPLPGADALQVAVVAGAHGRDVPLRIHITAGAVAMRHEGEVFVADLELRVMPVDRLPPASAEVWPLRFSRGQLPASGEILSETAQVTLPKKAARVLVSVYDPHDGTLLTSQVALPN